MERIFSGKMKIRIGLWIAVFLSYWVGPVLGKGTTSLPVPETLKDNVKFWTDIYAYYSSDKVVIHDSEHFFIYEVVDLGSYLDYDDHNDDDWKNVKVVKKKYENALRSLSRSTKIDTSNLTPTQLKVFKLWANIKSKTKFSRAFRKVRAQRGLSDHFELGLERSGRYIKHIERALQKNSVPKDLAVLPIVESLFNHRAYSKMGAAGLWQFTRYTGRLYLTINYVVDERFDPIKSTEAAAKLLKHNYDELGTWPLAITAYNHGLAGMRRATRITKTNDFGKIVDNYKSRSFGFASKNFYAEFIAAKNIWQDYRHYFGEINFQKPPKNITFALPDYVKLSTLMNYFDIDLTTVSENNPALRQPVLESKRYIPKGYQFRIPQRDGFNPYVEYAQIPDSQKYSAQVRDRYYKVRRGDTLSRIAARYGISLKSLMAMNNIPNPHRIHIGQTIEVPPAHTYVPKSKKTTNLAMAETSELPSENIPGGGVASKITDKVAEAVSKVQSTPQVADASQKSTYTVEPDQGSSTDTLALSVDLDNAFAGLHNPFLDPHIDLDSFQYSEKSTTDQYNVDSTFFKVHFEQPVGSWIIVQPDETLGHYADWLGLPTQTLRLLNHLSYYDDIRLGQRITLLFDKVSKEEFHHRRTEYHRGIQEDFFTRFQVIGKQTHTVQTGENIWHLCSRLYDVPYWLLVRYNSDKNLMQLHPGDVIVVPDISVRTAAVKSLSDLKTIHYPAISNRVSNRSDGTN